MGIIDVNGIRVYAYHGCLQEEAVIGQEYVVDVKIRCDFSKAIVSDDLSHTVDYCTVYEIVKREMKIRSQLIEHVAYRIAGALKKELPTIQKVKVKLTKPAAPLNGSVNEVAVTVIL